MEQQEKKPKLGFVFIRSLLSYLIILALPLIFLSSFYSIRFLNRYYDEIFETVDLELAQMATEFENQITNMEYIVGQLSLMGTVKDVTLADSIMDLTPTMTTLSIFTSANPFLADIILMFDQSEWVISPSTTSEKSSYFDRVLTTVTMGRSDLLQLLATPKMICVPSQPIKNLGVSREEQRSLLFIFPLFTDYNRRVGSAIFQVKEKSVLALVSQRLRSYEANVSIGSIQGSTIYESNPSQLKTDSDILRSYRTRAWQYTAHIPHYQHAFSQIQALRRDYITTIILTLALSAVVITLLQTLNYRPMRMLNTRARQLLPTAGGRDELSTISNAMEYLSDRYDALSTRLEGTLSSVRAERMYRLITGRYESRHDFNMDAAEIELELPWDTFVVALLLFHARQPNLDEPIDRLLPSGDGIRTLYAINPFNPRQMILLFNLGKDLVLDASLLQSVQDNFRKQHLSSVTIGVGSQVQGTKSIFQSYIEADSALEHHFSKGNDTILLFTELEESQYTYTSYPHRQFEALHNTLLVHNEEEIKEQVQEIIVFMENQDLPLHLVRSICFNLIHLVNEFGLSDGATNPIELSGMETAQEIIALIREWSDRLKVSKEGHSSIEEVFTYLNDNCLRCDFSVYETAEHFGMTLPAFSKFFKTMTGHNVIDYTLGYRMSTAKILLEKTDMPLKDISEKVGYYNMSSFTRRFKSDQGITPSEYRKLQDQETH